MGGDTCEWNYNFSDLIDDHLRKESHPAKIGVYWPSEIGACIRMNYYKRFIPREMPKEKLRLFRSGDAVHDFIREVLAKSDKVELLDWERSFKIPYDDFVYSGRLDDLILVRIAEEKMPVVVEVKSISGKTIEHIRHPNLPHLFQIHPYMYEIGARLGVIWYIARDTFADRPFPIFYDESIMTEAFIRTKRLHLRLLEHVLPEPEARTNRDLFPCRTWRGWMCPYWRECRDDYNPCLEQT
jgi:hypothetical protein